MMSELLTAARRSIACLSMVSVSPDVSVFALLLAVARAVQNLTGVYVFLSSGRVSWLEIRPANADDNSSFARFVSIFMKLKLA
jgi:hypothetical protein